MLLLISPHILGNDDPTTTIEHTISGYSVTLSTFTKLCTYQITSHHSWYRMRLRVFHSIMLLYFIYCYAYNIIAKPIRTALLCLLYPILPVIHGPLYWDTIVLACIGLLQVELCHLIFKIQSINQQSATLWITNCITSSTVIDRQCRDALWFSVKLPSTNHLWAIYPKLAYTFWFSSILCTK